MTIVSRMQALQRQLSDLTSEDPDVALEACQAGRWTWALARTVLGDRQLGEMLEHVLRGAQDARRRRDHGDGPWLGTATQVASEIVSYCPAEAVPPTYREHIERNVLEPNRLLPFYFVDGLAAMLVLGTPDGLDEPSPALVRKDLPSHANRRHQLPPPFPIDGDTFRDDQPGPVVPGLQQFSSGPTGAG